MQHPVISLMQCYTFITLFTHQNYFLTISKKNKISEKNSCVLTQVFLMITSHILEQNCQSDQTDVSERKKEHHADVIIFSTVSFIYSTDDKERLGRYGDEIPDLSI